MLGEREYGEMDIILKPKFEERSYRKVLPEDYYTDYYFINNTKFSEIMSKFKEEDNPYYRFLMEILINVILMFKLF